MVAALKMVLMVPASLLKAIYFFSNFSDEEMGLIQEISDSKKYASNETVFEEGSEAVRLYLVAEGSLSVQKDGQEVARLGQGETFGEMPFLDGGTRSATILSQEPSELVEIPYSKLSTILLNHPEMALKFYIIFAKHVSKRLRATTTGYQKAK